MAKQPQTGTSAPGAPTSGLDQHTLLADQLATIGSLAAGVAHEINNPLTYLMTSLQQLQLELQQLGGALDRLRSTLTEQLGAQPAQDLFRQAGVLPRGQDQVPLEQLVEEALHGAARVATCVRDLKIFSNVEDGSEQREQLAVPPLLDKALDLARNEIRYRATVSREYLTAPMVLAAPGKLSRALLHLVLNAAQSMDEGQVDDNLLTVRVRPEPAQGLVLVEVQDTGCGIPEEHRQRLYEPYFTTKPAGKGTGMGLAITHGVVRAMGGTIEILPAPRRGTLVRLSLPAEDEQRAGVKPARPAPPAAPRRGRLLVVDDETSIRVALLRMLSIHHEVVEADCGAAAISVLEQPQARFDVVLCDLMMGRGSGMDLHQWLEANRPALARRTLFLTGGAVTAKARAFLARMQDRTLTKPMDVPLLLQRIQQLVALAVEEETDESG